MFEGMQIENILQEKQIPYGVRGYPQLDRDLEKLEEDKLLHRTEKGYEPTDLGFELADFHIERLNKEPNDLPYKIGLEGAHRLMEKKPGSS